MTDDFEATLRRRLADLADAEDDWDDPLPAARERAAAGIAPDDDPAIVPPTPLRPPRRRWLPGLAVAAVLLAVVVGAGLGIRELAGSGGSSGSAGSAAMADGGAASCAVPGCDDTALPGGPPAPATGGAAEGGAAGSCVAGDPGPCHDVAGCETTGTATSSGLLASIATIRPSGITGPTTTPGGSAAIPYQLTFGESGGTAQVRPARAVWADGGQLCASPGSAESNAVQVVPVEPGPGTSGSATFTAVDSDGRPLPAGEYQAVVVIAYEIDGSELAQLVSPPVTVTVSAS